MLYLGIDQHGKQLTVNLRDENGEVILRRQVSTRWDQVRSFLQDVQQRSVPEGYVVIVEVCGFNDWLLELLPQYGAREVVLIQATERGTRKTDRRDANQLSELLWVNRQRLLARLPVRGVRRVTIPSAADQEDRRLTCLRQQVSCERTKCVNRIKHMLRRHNVEQSCPTKGIQTQRARKWLRELELAGLDRLELDHLLQRWVSLDEQQEELDRRIKERQALHPDAPLLATMPGSAAYTSLGLAARVGGVGRFPRPRSLANYWGLTPSCSSSGEMKRLGSISKEGSAMARYLLNQMVLHVLRRDGVMREWYKRIKRRRGSKIARVAVMRRLATIIWHMLKRRVPYQLSSLQPATAAEPATAATVG